MLELAANYNSADPVRVREIAEHHDIPPRFLVQILLQLKATGLINSTRGASGGYRLNYPPREVTLAQVMQAIDGDSDQPEVTAESAAMQVLYQTWNEAAEAQREVLEAITFAELLEQARSKDADMYYI
ncbi:Putative HTH-type transcriptional regulator rrf2-like [Durusdinium trenchii]|uniref:HTH-type transcriptional regulator rrf2-like n=1 Tax=Durusdinium trenchii TaxID=1381693 RepID=A0ABP0MMQ5_9DINO